MCVSFTSILQSFETYLDKGSGMPLITLSLPLQTSLTVVEIANKYDVFGYASCLEWPEVEVGTVCLCGGVVF